MKNRLMSSIFGVVVFACSTMVLAQAAQQPASAEAKAKPIPRTPDGKPDLSGVWLGARGDEDDDDGGGRFGSAEPLELTKWGLEKFRWNRGPESANAPGVYRGVHTRVEYDPIYHCYPPGLARLGPPPNTVGAIGNAIEILQTPRKVIIVYQYRNSVRHIYADGREHPKNLELTWNGHSIGKWDGDTLVVDTIGLRDESWLDNTGHEHSTELHVIERFRRIAANRLEIERTLIDPIALAKPDTRRVAARLSTDYDIDPDYNQGKQYDCHQFMLKKPFFGEGEGGLLGLSEPTTGKY